MTKFVIPCLKAPPFRTHGCTYTGYYPRWNVSILDFNAVGETSRNTFICFVFHFGSFKRKSNMISSLQLPATDLQKKATTEKFQAPTPQELARKTKQLKLIIINIYRCTSIKINKEPFCIFYIKG